jgi:gliding motility-associated-like protein
VVLLLGLASPLLGQEICDNGIDDDGNGLIDLNDEAACPCTVVLPQPTLLANGSFEDHTCCPEWVSSGPVNDISCASSWYDYMTTATVDYFNCDFLPVALPQPVPGGSAAAGFGAFTDWSGATSYYEFLATCLQSPMIAGGTYAFNASMAATRTSMSTVVAFGISWPVDFGPIELTLYGLPTCPTLPLNPGGPATVCPTALGWTELGHVTYVPTNSWQEVSFSFTAPFDVQAIMFGPGCPIPTDYISYNQSWPYFFVDEMSLDPVELTIDRIGHVCTEDLQFTCTPYVPATTDYQWYLNGVAIVGQTGQQLNASALGLGEGVYQLRAVSGGWCLLATDTVEVDWPEPGLLAVPTSGCTPLEVDFTDASTNTPITISLWEFGDGATATTLNATHTYTEPGAYDVRLTVTSPEGCTRDSLFLQIIEVFGVPEASFIADTLQGCPGLEVTFTNTSVHTGTFSCTWDLDDGTGSTDCDPVHVYSTPGTFDVRLTVTSSDGCADDTLATALIQILPVPAPAFTVDPAQGCIPFVVRFDNLTPGATALGSEWDLGNGEQSTTTHAQTTYTDPGTYTVSLTMTNELGCSATLVYADTITANPLPVVVFTVVPDTGCAPLTASFQQLTDPALTGSCLWDFGDGSHSSNCSPQHVYATPGLYDVALQVTSPAGCPGDTVLYDRVVVLPSPRAQFAISPQPTYLFATDIQFTDLSSPDVTEWEWDLGAGDPATSTEPSPSSTFPFGVAGEYPVSLVVTNEHGCTDTAYSVVRIDGLFSVYVPNSFTPNGDGINDVFRPIIQDAKLKDYRFMVFDRWGEEIYTTTDLLGGWDGSVNGADPKTDVYVWRMLIRSDTDGLIHEFRGHVTLLR